MYPSMHLGRHGVGGSVWAGGVDMGVSQHALGQVGWGCGQGVYTPPPHETATEAGSAHPTVIHACLTGSCFVKLLTIHDAQAGFCTNSKFVS